MQRGIIAGVAGAAFTLGLCCGSVAAQTRTIYINDNHGNQAVGTVIDGNVFFHDNRGNISVGTIRDGNVFLNSNSGETIFGTVKNGNVFLTDRSGITTGTVQNGNIFLQNSNGSITTGTYDSSGNMFTSTSAPSTTTAQQTTAQNQAAYDAGYAMGNALGNGIAAAVEHHRLKEFCRANPTATYVTVRDGYQFGTLCQDAPFSRAQQESIDQVCRNNSGLETGIDLHKVRCVTPPPEPNVKWARWEMDGLRRDYQAQAAAHSPGMYQAWADWTIWSAKYCRLAGARGSYKGLDGKKQHCR